MNTTTRPLVEAKGLIKSFSLRSQAFERPVSVRALDGVDIEVYPGETVAVVGESGSGKSTLGRALLMLDPPTAGSVRFDDQELVGLPEKALRPLRRRMQMVFQDPFGSLNPRMTIREILAEPFLIHGLTQSSAELELKITELLDSVRLPRSVAERYPLHEPWLSRLISSLQTNPSPHWTFRFRRRFSDCSQNYAKRGALPICSSLTIWRSLG
jgi:ABC-type microcin C transport system duplicated ATPase subunit YejF